MGILASFLVDFENATQIVSGEKYPTISFIQRIILAFEKRLVPKESDVPFIAETKEAMLNDLNTRYQEEDVKDLINIASALDPRFKTHTTTLTKQKVIALTEKLNENDYYIIKVKLKHKIRHYLFN